MEGKQVASRNLHSPTPITLSNYSRMNLYLLILLLFISFESILSVSVRKARLRYRTEYGYFPEARHLHEKPSLHLARTGQMSKNSPGSQVWEENDSTKMQRPFSKAIAIPLALSMNPKSIGINFDRKLKGAMVSKPQERD